MNSTAPGLNFIQKLRNQFKSKIRVHLDKCDIVSETETNEIKIEPEEMHMEKLIEANEIDYINQEPSSLEEPSILVVSSFENQSSVDPLKSEPDEFDPNKMPFKCAVCNEGFIIQFDLEQHLQTHIGKRTFKCLLCTYSSPRKQLVNDHVRAIHLNEKPFKCLSCDYSAFRKVHLQHHIMSKHTNERQHKCTVCSYQTVLRSNLKVHMMRHMKVKPHRCPYCNVSCVQNNKLEMHIKRRHRKEAREAASDELFLASVR